MKLKSDSYELNKNFRSEERDIIIKENLQEDFFKKGINIISL